MAINSHIVPKCLLEQFAYEDTKTQSLRLWRYRRGLTPRWDAAPKSAARCAGYFESSQDAEAEAQIEIRLAQEIENPVHKFLPKFADRTFRLDSHQRVSLAKYIPVLFNRSRARRAAMKTTQRISNENLQRLLSNPQQLATIAAKWNIDAFYKGLRFHRLINAQDVEDRALKVFQQNSSVQDQQNRFVDWMLHCLTFTDQNLSAGTWTILRTNAEEPFLLADSPVVSFSRMKHNELSYGEGFDKPNVEVLLPVAPSACLHIVPAKSNGSHGVLPTVSEVNYLQSLFVNESGFTNQSSATIEALVNAHGGKARIGENCYMINPTRYETYLYDTLMSHNA
jgi:hypothetical protein